MIEAKILLDSINPKGCRLTTWVLTYPRIIHAELLTHRQFSRNSSSSRALPIRKMIKDVLENPFIPCEWPINQSGMQADGYIEDENQREQCRSEWLRARDNAVLGAESLLKLGVHKQIANRLLEPFSHITVLLSATEMENFFALRAEKHAQPEFQLLAHIMLSLYNTSNPIYIQPGEWHIPFGDQMVDHLSIKDKIAVCVARAARVSYKTFDGEINHQKDIALHDSLAENGHFSCFEHVALCMNNDLPYGNFRGWQQYRKMCVRENRKDSRVIRKAVTA